MTKGVVIGFDLFALGLLIAYWEWRYRTDGWGRGWMRQLSPPKHHHGYVERIERMVWGEPTVKSIPKEWEFDLPLPEPE